MIIHVSSVSELENLIEKSAALVLDFYADWCGPCRNLGKFLESVKDNNEYKNVVFCKLDVDNPEFEHTCTKYNVSGIPHVVFFKNSKEVKTVVGFSEAKIHDALKIIV